MFISFENELKRELNQDIVKKEEKEAIATFKHVFGIFYEYGYDIEELIKDTIVQSFIPFHHFSVEERIHYVTGNIASLLIGINFYNQDLGFEKELFYSLMIFSQNKIIKDEAVTKDTMTGFIKPLMEKYLPQDNLPEYTDEAMRTFRRFFQ